MTLPDSPLDVLVVGAGPTGLVAAIELLRHGVSCRVIDELDAPVTTSKAAVVHARTMEIFDDMGLAPAILGHAKVVSGARVYSKGKQIAHVDVAGIDSPFPHLYGISQHDTEKALGDQLVALGGTVERGKRLDSLDLRSDGVTARLAQTDGTTEAVEAKWVLGCDGAHSAVRKALGFAFEGAPYEERLVQADVHVDWAEPGPSDEALAFFHPDGPVLCFPLFKDGRYRVIALLFAGVPEIEATLESLQGVLDARGVGAKLSDPAWTIGFRIHHRLASRYRQGRAFVAGDAAHIHSPVGGQGMNTGIQDAYNLAWKLALVMRGAAHESLLDSYEAERRPIAEGLLEGTHSAMRTMEHVVGLTNPLATGLRDEIVSLATRVDAFKTRVVQMLSMVKLDYRTSPIVREDRLAVWQASFLTAGSSEHPGVGAWAAFGDAPAPGDRAPDAPIEPATTGRARLFDLFHSTRHVALLFRGETGAHDATGLEALEQIGARLAKRFGAWVDVHLVVPTASRPADLKWSGSVLCDGGGAIGRRYGARAECLYLVRPDGYVAYRAQPVKEDALFAYLATVLRG